MALVWDCAENYIFGDQPTRRALAGETKYALSKEINAIESAPLLATDNAAIETAFVRHYTSLSSSIDSSSYSDKLDCLLVHMRQLSEAKRQSIQCAIQLELEHANNSLTSRKSPGPNGIGAEFCKRFKSEISRILLKLFLRADEIDFLPLFFSKSYTVVIPKTEEVAKLQRVTGYRPITLSNVECKMFAKVLANRLQFVISDFVGDNQTCGIRGRTNEPNTYIARSVPYCCSIEMGDVWRPL